MHFPKKENACPSEQLSAPTTTVPPPALPAASLARCVCQALGLPVLPFVADMLGCEPVQIGALLLHLHVFSALPPACGPLPQALDARGEPAAHV